MTITPPLLAAEVRGVRELETAPVIRTVKRVGTLLS
jgi:hypothetical protein